MLPPTRSRSRNAGTKRPRQPIFPAVSSECECDETSVNKSLRLRHESAQLSFFSPPLPCSVCRAAEDPQDFALCLAKWGSSGGVPAPLWFQTSARDFPLAVVVFQLNVIFLGIALYKMFHHTAILKPDSGCLDNIK